MTFVNRPSRSPSVRFRLLALGIGGFLVTFAGRSPISMAADNLWVGGASNGNFTDNANWSSPPSFGFGNSLKFNANTNAPTITANYGTWLDNNDIFWDATFPVARTLQSTGNGLGFKLRLENQSSFAQTVTAPLSGGLNGAGGIELNPVKGSLILSGQLYNDNSVDYAVYGSNTATLTYLTLNTALGPNATQTNVDFTVAGGRNTAVQVNASQLWGGTTSVQSGSFTTGTGVTLASSAIVVAGGTVTTTSANTFADTATVTVTSGQLAIGGSDTVASLAGSGGTVDVASGATLTFGGSGSASYAGSLTGSGNLTKVGSGTFGLTSASSLTGTTAIVVGQFALGGSNLLADTSAVAVAGGVLALGGNSDTVGTFAISGGSLTGSGTVTAASYTLAGGTVSANLGSGGVNVTGNASLNGTSNGTTLNLTSGTLTLGSAGRLAATTAVAVTGSAGGALALGGNETIGSLAGAANVALGSGALTVGGNNQSTTYSGNLSGSGPFTKLGSGTLTLTGANSNSGGTTVIGGRLVGTTSSLQGAINNGAAVTFDQATSGTYSGALSGGGSLTKLGSGTVTLTGNNFVGSTVVTAGGLVGTTSSLTGAITNNAAVTFDQATSGTYSAAMTGSGSLTKLGSGTVTLTGSNSYGGGTVVTAGGLVGTTKSLQGAITNNAAVTFDLPDFVASGTYSGAMTGSGSLTKIGSGALTLTGNNSYGGGTVVTAGGLVGTTSSLQGAITNNSPSAGVYNGGVIFDQATSGTYSGVIGGSGAVTKRGAGVVQFTAANTYTGETVVAEGGLILNGSIVGSLSVASLASLSGTGTVGGNATIYGIHSPGNSPGVQTFNGNLRYDVVLDAGAVVNWELIANTTGSPGVNYDQIIVTGSYLWFSGSTTLALGFNSAGSTVDWSDSFWNVNRSWTVYDLTGGETFQGVSRLALGGSLLDSLGNTLSPTGRGYFTTSLSGQDVMLNFVAVPEPSTVGIVLSGLGLAAGTRCRKRRATGGR